MAVKPEEPGSPSAADAGSDKAAGAYRTIGELARETGLAQHILRYWETRFPQLRPLQRAGNRRYYRPEDVALVHRIAKLLSQDGYTIRGVQQALLAEGKRAVSPAMGAADSSAAIVAVRDRLAAALADDSRGG
ncbi:MerR family transcriptional regulator [Sphingomonas sp. RB3P16]|uniref:MerR family transcriptional regulator n=1 Tax=Parasphingomonas frigoris TaxID=3096163 RepID=UPI002FCBC764